MTEWIPSYIPVRSCICARYDCNARRQLYRRYCQKHALMYRLEARARDTKNKLVRLFP